MQGPGVKQCRISKCHQKHYTESTEEFVAMPLWMPGYFTLHADVTYQDTAISRQT